jgi:hypothetical protein
LRSKKIWFNCYGMVFTQIKAAESGRKVILA